MNKKREDLLKNAAFVDGQFKDPNSCPESNDGKCSKCGKKLNIGYGFAGGYGLGSYKFCWECSEFYDFIEDKE